MPNINELGSLGLDIVHGYLYSQLNSKGFSGMQNTNYWSSTTPGWNGDYAMITQFSQHGEWSWYYKNSGLPTLPVRGGEGRRLTVSKSGTGTGSITLDSGTLDWAGNTATATYGSGTVVTLTATADSGSSFAGWSGPCTGTDTCTVNMSGAINVTATFSDSPVLTFGSGPAGFSTSGSGNITFSGNEAVTFQCNLDGAGFSVCSSPFAFGPLANGQHTLVVRATDGGGNTTDKSYSWTVNSNLMADGAIGIFATGQTTNYHPGDDGQVRAGIVAPSPRFTDNSNGTLTDLVTGLVWLKNASCFSATSFDQSLQNAKGIADARAD
jgi:hypothetical protein